MTNAITLLMLATNLTLYPVTETNGCGEDMGWSWRALDRYTFTGSNCPVDFFCYDLFIPTNAMTVTVSTNVVKGSNAQAATTQLAKYGYMTGCLVAGCTEDHNIIPAVPETERTETTIVTERRVLRFRWLDVWREVVSEKELSRTVKRWQKREQWEATP